MSTQKTKLPWAAPPPPKNPNPIQAERYLDDPHAKTHPFERIFNAKAAYNDGTLRRKISWVEKFGGENLLAEHVEKRGFHLAKYPNDYIIVCMEDFDEEDIEFIV